MISRARAAAFLCLAVSTASAGAAAQTGAPTAADKAAADVLYQQGKKLMKDGKYAEACPKFAESNRLDPGIGTMLWLADCYEKNGQTASAWGEFREAQAEAAKQKDTREKVAGERAAALANKLSMLVIGVSPSADVPGLEIKRDGTMVGKPLWGTKVPVDPGSHRISATAPGKKAWETTIDVPAKPGVVEVAVLPLENAVAAPPPPPPPPPPPEKPPSSWTTQHTLAAVAGGVAVVGLGLGTYFGLHSKSKLDDSNADGHCREGNSCDATGVQLRSDAKDAGAISTVMFAVGLTAAAGAVVLWFTAPKAQPQKTSGSWVLPAVGPGRASIELGGSW
jgi:serine/threonine-protein kinase